MRTFLDADSRGVEAGSFRRPQRSSSSRSLAAVTLLASLSGLRAAVGYWGAGATLTPDTSLYVQGGVGLFPSPLGRLVGWLGVDVLAFVNVWACVLLVLVVADFARALGGSAVIAALCVVLCPLTWWSMFAGVDTIAAVALVYAAFAYSRGHRTASAGLAAIAVGFHLAALLIVVAALLLTRPRTAALLASLGALVCLVTPYRGLLLDVSPFTLTTSALVSALVFVLCLPMYVVTGRVAVLAVPALLGGVAAAGLCASTPFETNMRYLLPAAAFGSVCVGLGAGNSYAAARSAAARARAFFGGSPRWA